MSDPKQLYLFNEMEYDDYEPDDWDDLLNRYDDIELIADTMQLDEIVNEASDIAFYNFIEKYTDTIICANKIEPFFINFIFH